MRTFDYIRLADQTWDMDIRQALYIRQKPVELERLVEIAKIQSTETF